MCWSVTHLSPHGVLLVLHQFLLHLSQKLLGLLQLRLLLPSQAVVLQRQTVVQQPAQGVPLLDLLLLLTLIQQEVLLLQLLLQRETRASVETHRNTNKSETVSTLTLDETCDL